MEVFSKEKVNKCKIKTISNKVNNNTSQTHQERVWNSYSSSKEIKTKPMEE